MNKWMLRRHRQIRSRLMRTHRPKLNARLSVAKSWRGSRSRSKSSRTTMTGRKRSRSQFMKKHRSHSRNFAQKVKHVVQQQMSPAAVFLTRSSFRLVTTAPSSGGYQAAGELLGSRQYDVDDLRAIQIWATQIGAEQSAQYQISKWMCWYIVRNMTNFEITLKLWDCVARFDVPAITSSNPQDLWSRGLTLEQQSGGGSTTVPTINTFGITPFMSRAFTQSYKVVRYKSYKIKAGAMITHRISSYKKPTIKMSRYYDTVGGQNLIQGQRGLFRFTMYVLHGDPLHNPQGTVGIGDASVDVCHTERAYVRYNTFQNYPIYNFGTTGYTFGTPASQTGLVEVTAAAATTQFA